MDIDSLITIMLKKLFTRQLKQIVENSIVLALVYKLEKKN